MVYLRARHYAPGTGRFLTRDTWSGDTNIPLSFNKWVYVEDNPINYSDPTGLTPMQSGYIEGKSFASGLGYGGFEGSEIVYDYATMTRARFTYRGQIGGLFASIGGAIYFGKVNGFRYEPKPLPIGLNSFPDLPYSQLIIADYRDWTDGWYAGGGIPTPIPWIDVGGGIGGFTSRTGNVNGSISYVSASTGLMPFEIVGYEAFYIIDKAKLPGYQNSGIEYYYDTKTRRVNRGKLVSDILTGDHTPIHSIPGGALTSLTSLFASTRSGELARALSAASRFEKYYYQPIYGQCILGQPDILPLPPFPDPFENPFNLPTFP